MALEHLLRESLVEVGKLKIGTVESQARQSRSGGEWRAPVKLDHFIITTLMRDANQQLIPDRDVMDSLKDYAGPDGKLRRVPVFLLSNNLDEILTCNYVVYSGKTLVAKSDGETLTEYFDKPGGRPLPMPRKTEHTPEAVERWKMKLFTTLNVMIASQSARFGGVYKFRTTSVITANQLYGSLTHLRKGLGGLLRGVPLQLVVRPMQVAPEGKPSTVYVVHAELNGTDLKALRDSAMEQLKFELANVKEVRALEAQYRALVAHVDDPDAEEMAAFNPPAEEPVKDAEYTAAPQPDIEPEDGWTAGEYAAKPARFLNLMERKGATWKRVIATVNAGFDLKLGESTDFAALKTEHLEHVAAKLMARPDVELVGA